MQTINTDLCILGAGSGGLSVAAGASQMGVKVVLIEPHQMGGECLNTGCVPSKALIHVANQFHNIHNCSILGIQAQASIDFQCVYDYVKQVIATIEPNDSQLRFEELGVTVIREQPRFIDSNIVETENYQIKTKKFVIATGSSPAIPTIDGLIDIEYLTNENIFDLTELPKHLIIIGGGPIGCELGQAFRLLGSEVTILQRDEILSNDDKDCRDVIRQDLIDCGIQLHENTDVLSANNDNSQIEISYQHHNQQKSVTGTHLLIATGRKANTVGLDLDKANVNTNERGITIDNFCRTSQKHIYAIGDVCGPYRYTHAAGYQAGIVIRNALFRLPAKCSYQAMPHITYTRLELAQVGITEEQTIADKLTYQVTTFPFSEIDRAVAQTETQGFIKVITNKKGRVLGVSIVGKQAGELIIPWIIAIQKKQSIKSMTEFVTPYPTRSDIHKRVAGKYYLPSLASSVTKKIVKLLF